MYIQEIPNKAVHQIAESCSMLPEDFRVYVSGNTVINHPMDGFDERILPTFNDYKGTDGGYVAIYTHNAEKGVYGVGDGIYVIGLVRIQGEYVGRIFIPVGYKLGDDITQDAAILAICEKYFPEMKGDMWVGGDTGDWTPSANNVDNVSNASTSWVDDDWGTRREYDDEGWPIHREWD